MNYKKVFRGGEVVLVSEEELFPPLTPEQVEAQRPYKTQDDARDAMIAWIDGLTAQVEAKYPAVVRQLWPEEEEMALAYLSETESPDQLEYLTEDALRKGRTPAEHAQRILEKAQAFRGIAVMTRRLFLATEYAIEANSEPAVFEAILESAIEEAAPIAAAYGLGT